MEIKEKLKGIHLTKNAVSVTSIDVRQESVMQKILCCLIGTLFFSNAVHAEPISFAGISFSQSKNEMMSVLTERNFDCGINGFQAYECTNEENVKVRFFPGKAQMDAFHKGEPNGVLIDCGVYNGCGTPRSKIIAALENRYSFMMQFEQSPVGMNIGGHCGIGDDGDKICLLVGSTDLGGQIFLDRAELGVAKPVEKKLEF